MRNKIQEFRIEDKHRIITTSLSNKSKLCSTCAFWAGSRKVKPSGKIEIHPYSKGECEGGGFSYVAMSAMATCDKWELWSPMNMGSL
jgi:hypothetical protein